MLIENVLKSESSWSECGYQDEYNCLFFIQNWQQSFVVLFVFGVALRTNLYFCFLCLLIDLPLLFLGCFQKLKLQF